MLQSLVTLSDLDIERVASAVHNWCRTTRHRDINSCDGHQALTTAVAFIPSKLTDAGLDQSLAHRPGRIGDSPNRVSL